jgi:homoserine O-acetyltransferase/O-succinyltransferase
MSAREMRTTGRPHPAPPQVDGVFEAPDFTLQSGAALPVAQIAYRAYGALSEARDNAVLFPTWFSSTHHQNAWLIGEGRALDPQHYFVVCANLLGNGLSSSPSNTPSPFDRARFPRVSVLDNVRLQRRLLTEIWGIERLALVIGRSMGAQAAFQWASYYPEMVARLLAFSGSSKTTPHNYVLLEGVKAALTADAAWRSGEYIEPPRAGLRAVGRIYAGWALSQAYYREHLYRAEGADTLDAYLAQRWDANFANKDANDLLCQIATWQHADISANERFEGDWLGALSAIRALALVMPCRSDLYFPPEDSAAAVAHMPNAELRVIESMWGHRAAAPGSDPGDIAFLERAVRELLATDVAGRA